MSETQLTQAELYAQMAEKTGWNKTMVAKAMTAYFEIASESLANQKAVPLPGLGKLVCHRIQERTGRNPRTGKAMIIPEHNKVKLKPSKEHVNL